MNPTDIHMLNFKKLNGLIPAVVIDESGTVLMLGFMNEAALKKTIETKLVTFFSRTKNELWTKGSTSGNYLHLIDIKKDCDNDSLLITAAPEGNVCHTGSYSCFENVTKQKNDFLFYLFKVIEERKINLPSGSYTTKLFNEGADRIIQKVGEEAVETIIAAKNRSRSEVVNETADLLFHMLVMLSEQGIDYSEITECLASRHQK